MESVEVDVEGKRYEVRVKEVMGWIPSFKKEEHKRESEEVNQPQAFEKQGEGDDDSEEDMDDEFIADTFAKEEEDDNMKENYDPGDIQNEWGSNKDDRVDEVDDIRNTKDKEHGADSNRNDLVDVSLGGYQFMWVNSLATKMSKIDRFLISGGLLERFPDLAGTILDKGVPDHRPILLKEAKADYRPILF
ncbi:hypothetical protein Tco_0902923 [Tanacetum coccineum]